MHRTIAMCLALCVCSAVTLVAGGLPAVADADPGPTAAVPEGGLPGDGQWVIVGSQGELVTPAANTTAYLALPPREVSNATSTGASLDVGGALAADAAATGEAVPTLTLDERLSRANTTAAKKAVIRREGTRIERRITHLRADQNAAIGEYASGERSTREFVYALARTETRADELGNAIDRLETAGESVPGATVGGEGIDGWARDRRVGLGVVTSPVRTRITDAFRGEGAIGLYIEVSETGLVLATIDDGRYVREAYLPTERSRGPRDGPESVSAALGRVVEAYPWAWNHSTGVESAGGPAAGSYRFTIFHQQGRLTTQLDPETGSVFREVQVTSVGEIPTAPPITGTENGLRVRVDRTYPTGPMNVSVTDAKGGDPVNATVFVDNRTVGSTGSEGYLWTISPSGRVNVTAADGEQRATVRFGSEPQAASTGATASTSASGISISPGPDGGPPSASNTNARRVTDTEPSANGSAITGTRSLETENARSPGTENARSPGTENASDGDSSTSTRFGSGASAG